MYVLCVPWLMSLVRQNVNCATQSWLVGKKRVQLEVNHQISLLFWTAITRNKMTSESHKIQTENIKK